MESDHQVIRSVTHQVLARQIKCLPLARPFSPSRQRPSRYNGTRKSSVPCRLHSVAKEHWFTGATARSTLCLAGGRVESLEKSHSAGRFIELAEYPVQSVPWFEQPLSVAPNIPPKISYYIAFVFLDWRVSGASLPWFTSGGYGSAGVQ